MKKRLLSILLSVAMLLTWMSMTALAEETPVSTVTGWTWDDPKGNLIEGALTIPDVSEEAPELFTDVITLLPASITAMVEGKDEGEMLDVTWASEDYPETGAYTGEYTFTAELPENYILANETAKLEVVVTLIEAYLPGEESVICGDFTLSTEDADGLIKRKDYTYADNTLTIISDKAVTIRMTDEIAMTEKDHIVVPAGGTANITLAGVNIDTSQAGCSAFRIFSANREQTTANVTVAAETENVLKSADNFAGLQNSIYATLTISGSGSLSATGGSGSAGIGGGQSESKADDAANRANAGHILITGGVITAQGGRYGSGIGDGDYPSSSTVTIDGSHITISGGVVTAKGGEYNSAYGITNDIGKGGDKSSNHIFSTGDNGNAIISADTITDSTDKSNWSCILFNKAKTKGVVYGNVTLAQDLTIESGQTLTVPEGSTLTNNGIITNNGTITNDGVITNNGTIVQKGTLTGIETINGDGQILTAAAEVENTPTAQGRAYDGSTKPLVTAGTAIGGTMQYRLEDGDYSAEIPEAQNAKTYTVYYKVMGDDTHWDSDEMSIDVTIDKATPAIAESADLIQAYTGEDFDATQLFTLPDNCGTATYSLNGGTGTGDITPAGVLTVSGVGTFNIHVATAANDNYTEGSADVTLTVNKGTGAGTVSMKGYTYNGIISTPNLINQIGTGKATYYYNTTNSNTGGTAWSGITNVTLSAGDYWMYAIVDESDLYEGFTTVPVKFTVKPITLAATKSISVKLYGYDDIQASWNQVSGATGYKVYYKKSTDKKYAYKGSTTGTSMKLANLSDGAKYYVKVIPYQTIGGKTYDGSEKTSTVIYTLKKLATPKVSKKKAGSVTVKWTNIDGESGYQISKSTSKKKTSVVATVKTTSGKSTVIKVKKGKKYYYKVRAYSVVGKTKIYGPWSSVKAYTLK